jgi:hypothetical protein
VSCHLQIDVDALDDEGNARSIFSMKRMGRHGEQEKTPAGRGFSFSRKAQAINLLEKGLTAGEALKKMVAGGPQREGDDPVLPTLAQLQNLQYQLKKTASSKLAITSMHDLKEWATQRLITCQEQFAKLGPYDTCVLRVFETTFEKDGQTLTSVGVVHSSPAALKHFAEVVIPSMPVVENTGRISVSGLTDTTFKMISEKMVEAQFGCRGLYRMSSGAVRQSFVNVLNAISRTEKQVTYEQMLDCIGIIGDLTGIDIPDFDVEFISGDNCDGLINGCETLDLGAGRKTVAGICYPHMARQTLRSHLDKFQDQSYFSTANQHVEMLHLCRSRQSYEILFPFVMDEWREVGEGAIAEYFQKEYFMKNWTINASGIPGQDPNNNPIEANHRDSKRGKWTMNKAVPLSIYLNESLPIKYAYEANRRQQHKLCFGPLLTGRPHREVLLKAQDLVETEQEGRSMHTNYFVLQDIMKVGVAKGSAAKSEGRTITKGIVFNSAKTLHQDNPDNAMTKEFAHRYIRALHGHHVKGQKKGKQFGLLDVADVILTSHLVEVGRHGNVICDCKACCQTWECSHIYAYRHLAGDINLHDMVLTLKEAKPLGRPRNDPEPIHGGSKLLKKGMKTPGDFVGHRIRSTLGDHREYNGKVFKYRVKPAMPGGVVETVWSVRYPRNQHEDGNSSDEEEMNVDKLYACRRRYVDWRDKDENGKKYS